MSTAAANTAKTERLNIRVSRQDDALFREAASLQQESLSEFLVESARERAEWVLADRRRFVLEDSAWADFVEALDRPAEAKPAVVELFRRSKP
jgi:uncharacterized protein (DUF1778 family)